MLAHLLGRQAMTMRRNFREAAARPEMGYIQHSSPSTPSAAKRSFVLQNASSWKSTNHPMVIEAIVSHTTFNSRRDTSYVQRPRGARIRPMSLGELHADQMGMTANDG
jgi:hypothetical protein